MTFSIAGRCARTGQLGAAISTSNVAVGSRCPFARRKTGVVLTQHRTDPRLGPRGLDLLSSGCTAQETLDALVASSVHIDWRQLAVIDAAGRTASFAGGHIKSVRAEIHGRDCVAIGNILANDGVPGAMVAAFEKDPSQPLAERLLRALEAGLAAGGEDRAVRSAALLTVHEESFPYVDLRVDAADAPIAALRALWHEYVPWADEFVVRAVDPDRAKGAA
jgi:uncharacterized Ntn-hydrolase superfamily protein